MSFFFFYRRPKDRIRVCCCRRPCGTDSVVGVVPLSVVRLCVQSSDVLYDIASHVALLVSMAGGADCVSSIAVVWRLPAAIFKAAEKS